MKLRNQQKEENSQEAYEFHFILYRLLRYKFIEITKK